MEHMAKINIIHTKDEIINLLKNGVNEFGNISPTKLILSIDKKYNIDIRGSSKRLFGSGVKACEDAGINYKNFYWTNERIIIALKELNEKFGPLYVAQIGKFRKQKLICGAKLIRERFGSVYNAAKLSGFVFVEPQEVGHKFNGKKGQIETNMLKNIEKMKNIKLIPQYRVEVDNKLFFIDGYDKENNIAYEIDEKYHKHIQQQELDKQKDYYLQKVLNCEIIRIKNY